jgi:hypothetical protein
MPRPVITSPERNKLTAPAGAAGERSSRTEAAEDTDARNWRRGTITAVTLFHASMPWDGGAQVVRLTAYKILQPA